MRIFVSAVLSILVSACAHVEIGGSSNTSSAAVGTSGSAGLEVQGGSRSLAAAIVLMGLAAGAIEYSREDRSFPSPASLFPQYSPPAPELAPDRRISEQDCTRPIDFSSGNLRCK